MLQLSLALQLQLKIFTFHSSITFQLLSYFFKWQFNCFYISLQLTVQLLLLLTYKLTIRLPAGLKLDIKISNAFSNYTSADFNCFWLPVLALNYFKCLKLSMHTSENLAFSSCSCFPNLPQKIEIYTK